MNKIAECQKEFLFNSRCIPNFSVLQTSNLKHEELPKISKRLCKHTGRMMELCIPDEMRIKDWLESSEKVLHCMFNDICKNCEYYDFFV